MTDPEKLEYDGPAELEWRQGTPPRERRSLLVKVVPLLIVGIMVALAYVLSR